MKIIFDSPKAIMRKIMIQVEIAAAPQNLVKTTIIFNYKSETESCI